MLSGFYRYKWVKCVKIPDTSLIIHIYKIGTQYLHLFCFVKLAATLTQCIYKKFPDYTHRAQLYSIEPDRHRRRPQSDIGKTRQHVL